MAKKRGLLPGEPVEAGASPPPATTADVGASRPAVRGLGVLADSGLELETGIDLLEPIAEQVLARRGKSRAG